MVTWHVQGQAKATHHGFQPAVPPHDAQVLAGSRLGRGFSTTCRHRWPAQPLEQTGQRSARHGQVGA